jgi:hypothetical protein
MLRISFLLIFYFKVISTYVYLFNCKFTTKMATKLLVLSCWNRKPRPYPSHTQVYLNLFVSIKSREDWIIYRGPSSLAVVWFGSTPSPFPHSPDSKLPLPVCRWSRLLAGEGGGGRGAKLFDRKKAWSSMNHSILFVKKHRWQLSGKNRRQFLRIWIEKP